MTSRQCTECGDAKALERVASLTIEHGGKSLTVQDRQTLCVSCGNISYVGGQISDHELAIAAAVRQADGLLSADELRRIRAKYRLKQADLEQMLSTGPKTWTRWERGKVPQSKAADTLIRVIAEDPEIARRLMVEAGVQNLEAEAVFARIEEDAKCRARVLIRREVGQMNGIDAEQFASRLAESVFDTVRDVRRQAAAQFETEAA